jgi:plasmid stabilization system protein ParE
MKVVVRRKADDDVNAIHDWITKDNPGAARRVIARLRERIGIPETEGLAYIGRPGRVPGTRELAEAPFIIVYRVDERRGVIEVLSIVHGARNR